MSRIICNHKDRYNIYCTISDGFIFVSSLSQRQLSIFIKEQYGKRGLDDLPERLGRAHERGHSSCWDTGNLADFLSCNRAGTDEKHLSFKECVDQFIT